MRHFVVIGRTASASGDFSLDDLPSSSGRLDVLLRCVRAGMLTSHGLRRDVRVYLVLQGGLGAPRVVRIDARNARFLRPDERSLATLIQKSLTRAPNHAALFQEIKPGVSVASGALRTVVSDLNGATLYLLEEGAPDIRATTLDRDAAFFLGDHLGFEPTTRAELAALGARTVSVGPISLHSDDVVAVISNELDRAEVSQDPGT